MKETPNPGSIEANKLGCLCPVIDNAYGKGHHRGGFVINLSCKLHGKSTP